LLLLIAGNAADAAESALFSLSMANVMAFNNASRTALSFHPVAAVHALFTTTTNFRAGSRLMSCP
jgi:hypothetical protein